MKLCRTCEHWLTDFCTNIESEYFADLIDPDSSCEQWEGEDKEEDDEQGNDI